VGTTSALPKWIKPQLTRLVDEAPTGEGWLHEIKYDGYRMHARIDGRDILLTRTGLDWSHRYRATIDALRELKVKSAYLDGELTLQCRESPYISSDSTMRHAGALQCIRQCLTDRAPTSSG
jgi:ATP-dependent DNA ligase